VNLRKASCHSLRKSGSSLCDCRAVTDISADASIHTSQWLQDQSDGKQLTTSADEKSELIPFTPICPLSRYHALG